MEASASNELEPTGGREIQALFMQENACWDTLSSSIILGLSSILTIIKPDKAEKNQTQMKDI